MSQLLAQIFLLIGYGLFSYFFWIEKILIYAGLVLAVMIVAAFVWRPLRKSLSLSIVLFVTHLVLWLFKFSLLRIFDSNFEWFGWPLDLYILALIGFLLLRFCFPADRVRLNWSWRLTKLEWLSILLINVPSVFVLYWYFQNHPEVAEQWPYPDVSPAMLPLMVVGIALVNALREEIYYRGLLQSLSQKNFSPWFVISLQAVLFGSVHFANSFPQGWLGVGLTALWGAAIAIQYQIFRKITLAWLTHAIADAIMFAIILMNLPVP